MKPKAGIVFLTGIAVLSVIFTTARGQIFVANTPFGIGTINEFTTAGVASNIITGAWANGQGV